MRLHEIESKFFFININSILILESYKNPEQELSITFEQVKDIPGHYYAKVIEKSSNRPLVIASFSLSKNGSIDIGNIAPVDHPSNNKIVHTSLGTQYNGVDIVTAGIRWLKRQIKEYAKSKGYDLKNIISQTRYTGARAKNNQGSDEFEMPKTFNVSKQIKESLLYNCADDTFIVSRKIT